MSVDGHVRTAQDHARYASRLLASIAELERELAAIEEGNPERHLELVATGAITRLNRNMEHTLKTAAVHALTAIALSRTAWPE